jgi:hypothetical protein
MKRKSLVQISLLLLCGHVKKKKKKTFVRFLAVDRIYIYIEQQFTGGY